MKHVTVIGGGVAGLASAILLARDGFKVRLLEKNRELGGRVGCVQRDGFSFDTGPSWFLMPGVFDHFFELAGTSTNEQLDLHLLDPGYQVFTSPNGGNRVTPLSVPYGVDAVAALFERMEPGSGDVLREYLASANHAVGMAERYFLYNPFTRPGSLLTPEIIRSVPKLMTLLWRSLDQFVSQRFHHPVLRQVLGYHAVFLGTDPRQAPALYHLMSALDLHDGVRYPMGGFRRLIDCLSALAIQAGVEVVTDATVTSIITGKHGRRLRVLGVQWHDRDGAEHTEDADIVVSGADLHHTETELLSSDARSYPESWWRKIQSGPGAVVVLLGVRGELPQLLHHSLFFTSDWHANFDAIFGAHPHMLDPTSLYVCKPSATDSTVAPEGHENLFVLVPVPTDVGLGGGGPDGTGESGVEQIADAAIAQIGEWAGIANLRQRIVLRHTLGPADFARDYNSWKGGMLGPSHILRQSAMFRAQNESKKVGGLYYAGATTSPGVGVPMCLISAELVLKRIRGDHSAGPIPVRSSISLNGSGAIHVKEAPC